MKRKVAVLGATGMVGQQFIRMLDAHPYFDIDVLAASSKSSGKSYGEIVNWVVSSEIPRQFRNEHVVGINAKELGRRGIDIAFSALPSGYAKVAEEKLVEEGIAVFSNAGAHRMDSDVPMLIPEVNPEHLSLVKNQMKKHKGFLVTNSNCTTSGLVMVLKPLLRFGIKSVTVSSYQAVSGAGYPGLPSLDILGNVIPYIENEEEKVEAESKKILGVFERGRINEASFEVNATCARVHVRDGHLETLIIEFENTPEIGEIKSALARFKGIPQKLHLPTAPEQPIILREEANRPQPLYDASAGTPERAAGMAVSVGRLREKGRKIGLVLIVHNTIRGAAGTSILDAELALRKNYIK